jgi:flagella basal body P-ring formation protein FlgA
MILRRLAFAATATAIVAAGFAAANLARAAEKIPVPATTIYPGDTIAADMLTDGAFADGTSANFPIFTARDDLIGKVARRTLLPGKLIARNTVSEPELVQKGKIISAMYQQGPLTITTSVLALQSGGLDDAIQVRNIDSGKVIVGTVTTDGGVRIGPK